MLEQMTKTIDIKFNSNFKEVASNFNKNIEDFESKIKSIKPLNEIINGLNFNESIDQLKQIKSIMEELEDLGLEGSDKWKELDSAKKELQKSLGVKDKEDEDDKEKLFFQKWKVSFKPEDMKNNLIKGINGSWDKIAGYASKAWDKIKDFFVQSFKDAWNELKEQTTYDSNGYYYSEEAYNQQMQYGLSDAENFALSKTLKRLNMSREEYEMGGYNEKRAKALNELLEIERKNYEEMKASGFLDNMAKMRESFEKQKEEFKKTIMKFIVENGPVIMSVLKGTFSILQGISKAMSWLISLLDDGTQSAEEARMNVNKIIDSNTINNKISNISISNNMVAHNNNITTKRQLEEAGKQNGTQIARAFS